MKLGKKEAASTRRTLQRVPEGRKRLEAAMKKSMALGIPRHLWFAKHAGMDCFHGELRRAGHQLTQRRGPSGPQVCTGSRGVSADARRIYGGKAPRGRWRITSGDHLMDHVEVRGSAVHVVERSSRDTS